jgi:hypothetical protein
MQRRDPRSFLEGVLAQVGGLSADTTEQLLAVVADKPGTKRAAKLAAILAAAEGTPGATSTTAEPDDE